MRYDTGSRNRRNSDFEQFAQFLGVNGAKRGRTVQRNETNTDSCCHAPQKDEKSLAMVYPVIQNFCNIYDSEVGFVNGTIFEELNKPFYPTGCSSRNTEGCGR